MSQSVHQYIIGKIQERKTQNTFRSLFLPEGKTDFFSNDYLGIATNRSVHHAVLQQLENTPEHTPIHGATGSRLLSGNSALFETTEQQLATLHQTEAALLFNSGYNANLGILSALPYKNALIVYDELVHASMLDGINMSKAHSVSFKHNSIADLEEKLHTPAELKFIAIEALYSMDGDFAPLEQIIALAIKFDAAIILDEAHSTGIYGTQGEGYAQSLQLHKNIFIRIHTFGKAAGIHGAVALCTQATKEFLINYCRPFIFSTAMPPYAVHSIQCSYNFMKSKACAAQRLQLQQNIQYFKQLASETKSYQFAVSDSPIQTLFIAGNEAAKNAAMQIRSKGLEVRAILSPTVPKGTERIRICLHSFNTSEEIKYLMHTIAAIT
ncbi:MAG: 8-amino-7-oxononanoate synthase [Chitinophagales bacterium]